MGFETHGGGMTASEKTALESKADAPRVLNISDTVCTITAANNTEYRLGEISSLDITLPEGVTEGAVPGYAVMIHFSTGSTAPSVSYDEIKLKGDNVTIETDANGSYYLFEPQPNMRYDIGIEYDGTYVKGYVSGTELI